MTEIITRFAPSPTGNLHLGSARTALINFVISQQNLSSKFYLRIEDTDKTRSKEEYTKNIIESLLWLGLSWDSEPQIQSQRIEKHKEIANLLLENNYAYKCNCDEKKLEEKRKFFKKNNLNIKKICTTCKDDQSVQNLYSNYVVRIKIPIDGETNIYDIVQGNISVKNKELDDFIIIRKDGTPTYMLSVAVDDNDLGINYIIRGDDHLNNTFRQKYIYEFMEWKEPKYAHIPLIHGEDGSKLSKRHGAINIIELKKIGYLPEAVINNLILLGWSPNNKENENRKKSELITLEEIIKQFKLEKLSKSSSIFSYAKLNFFNNYYLRLNDNINCFVKFCKKHHNLKLYYEYDKNKLLRVFEIYKKNLNYYEEILNYINIYFDKAYVLSENVNKFDDIFEINFKEFIKDLSIINNWTKEELENFIKKFLRVKNIKYPIFAKPLRFILTKFYDGPSLSDIFFILGKKGSLERLNQYITKN